VTKKNAVVGLLALTVGLGGAAIAWRHHASSQAVSGWNGKVARILTGGGADKLSGTAPLGEGAIVTAGASISTDRRQRARLEMSDGTVLVLDRDTAISFDATPGARVVHVQHGVLRADVAHVDAASPAKVITARGEVTVVGTELTVTATDDMTDVQVSRGSVHARTQTGRDVDIEAGQEALLTASDVEIGPATVASNDDLLADAPSVKVGTGGVGELRARRPGRSEEGDRPLRIASHAVKVRIAGAMARTEIEESFANDTDDDLEGIYRFPVPANALVDRLALDVDDKLVDGSFVEKVRAEKILRGAIANATPREPVMQDIVWVPGPWRDPALLEWQQGGRFELRIFPIPKHGARRVVIGYTQTVASSLGLRRYTYPLPSVGGVRMDDFAMDVQVLGADDSLPVRTRGYDLKADDKRLTMHEQHFAPTGDLTVEYALPNRSSEMTAWTYDTGSDGRYAAFALRPKLPPTAEAQPRDWVVVVDAGRTMFGERFTRAKQVAVALARTLDRRDRMKILACDERCRASHDGFVPAGVVAAKATEDFLAGVVPDGASDLVGAVRAATQEKKTSELRVVLVSDGIASAGYKRPARVAEETRDAIGTSGASVLTVSVGADSDETVLSEIARGGGGINVPYASSEEVKDVAVALAGAGAGSMLRDATLVLPDGLESVAPAVLPTLRVGSETFLVAKMTAPTVKGDVVVRAGAFEARYPIDLHATTDAGNAFVPRLYAALRMRDLERQPTDDARKEAISLSQKYSVPSRHTSLLVLESEAMFKAFGIDRKTVAPRWTGEEVGESIEVSTPMAAMSKSAAAFDMSENEQGDKAKEMLASNTVGVGAGGGAGRALAAPTATMAPPFAMRRRPGTFMRRVSHREATITPMDGDGSTTVSEGANSARGALALAPNDRGKHKAYARALLRDGSYEELAQVVAAWQVRDPLDVDAITLHADGLAQHGQRDAAAHTILGIAGLVDAPRIDELARGAETRGDADVACSLRVAAAETTPDDIKRVARAASCERTRGHEASATRWLGEPGSRRTSIEAAMTREAQVPGVSGDVVLDAKWEGDEDLDFALVDPSGQRLGWLDGRARASDVASHSHEKLAVSFKPNGKYLVEVARTTSSHASLRGTVTVTAFGFAKRVPFELTGGPSARVASIDTRTVTELVPVDDWTASATFQPAIAIAHLRTIPLETCAIDGARGPGSAAVTFLPNGTVSTVVVAPPFAGTAAGACVVKQLRTGRIDPFEGQARTITSPFFVR
jgi:hypothetical protein